MGVPSGPFGHKLLRYSLASKRTVRVRDPRQKQVNTGLGSTLRPQKAAFLYLHTIELNPINEMMGVSLRGYITLGVTPEICSDGRLTSHLSPTLTVMYGEDTPT